MIEISQALSVSTIVQSNVFKREVWLTVIHLFRKYCAESVIGRGFQSHDSTSKRLQRYLPIVCKMASGVDDWVEDELTFALEGEEDVRHRSDSHLLLL